MMPPNDISRLLQLYNPQQMQFPTPAGPPTSFLDRVRGTMMPAPSGLMDSGLLSNDELKSARDQGLLNVGLSLLSNSGPKTADQAVRPFQALGQAVQQGQGAYQGAVQNAAQMRQVSQEFGAKKAALQKQQSLEGARKSIIQQYPVPANGSQADMAQWIDQVLPRFIEAGDDETVQHLADLRKSLAPKNDRYQQAQTGDLVTTYDTQTGKVFDPKTGQWVTAIERGMNPDEIALKKAQLAETRSRTNANLSMTQERSNQTAYNAFMTHNKDVLERAPIIKQALLTLRDAKGDPAHGIPARPELYSSTVANFIQAADQKAQIRWQLLQYFKNNVDPSVAGKWEVLKARMLQGTLPGYTMDGMITHLQRLLAMTEEDYARRRTGEIKRHPALEGWLPPSTEYFSEGSFGSPSMPGERPSLEQLWQGAQ